MLAAALSFKKQTRGTLPRTRREIRACLQREREDKQRDSNRWEERGIIQRERERDEGVRKGREKEMKKDMWRNTEDRKTGKRWRN